jgi:phage shock protein C
MADRLYRSRDDRMLAGVAGGLAEMWDADPALVRIVWALLVIFTGGVALVVYIVMAIVVPEEDDRWPAGAPPAQQVPTAAGAPDAATAAGTPPPAASGWATPPRDARATRSAARADRGMSGGMLLGGFLVLLGLFFLAREFLPSIDFDWFWPLVLVAVGATLLVSSMGRGPRSGGEG